MGKSKIFCDECNKEYIIKAEYISELFNLKCPKCKSEAVWFLDVFYDEPKENLVTKGMGGCSQKWHALIVRMFAF